MTLQEKELYVESFHLRNKGNNSDLDISILFADDLKSELQLYQSVDLEDRELEEEMVW